MKLGRRRKYQRFGEHCENFAKVRLHLFQLHYLGGEVVGGALPCSSAFVMMKSAHKENDEGGIIRIY